jgi:hypothetical protein
MSAVPATSATDSYADTFDDEEEEDDEEIEKQWQQWASEKLQKKEWDAWQLEAAAIDRSVQILPGVKKMMDSLPKGRYAVATSGAKTYGTFSCVFVEDSSSSLFFSSLRLHDPSWYYSPRSYDHCRRQASQGRQTRT